MPFWLINHHYPYHALHLVDNLPAIMAVLDQARPDVVVNYAAQGEGAASFGANAPDFFETNCTALIRLVLELQKRPYLKRFVQIGSSEVYGSPHEPATEKTPLWPTSPYSVSKAAFDLYLCSMWNTAKFPMNIVRPSNCYVEGQQLHRIIPRTIICALKGEKLKLHGGGVAVKSYMHARDLSRAVLRVIQGGFEGEIFNVGPDLPISIAHLVHLVTDACGVRFDDVVEMAPERTGQDAKYHLDSGAMKTLGWHQEIVLSEGIKRMVEWVRAYPELLDADSSYRHRR